MMAGEGPEYREFNFSPSGEWAVYDFRGYRDASEQDATLLTTLDPVIKEINFAEMPIMLVSISGDVSPVQLKLIADNLQDDFIPPGHFLGTFRNEALHIDVPLTAAWYWNGYPKTRQWH